MRLDYSRKQHERWMSATQDLSPHTVRAYQTDVHELERFLGSEFDVRRLDAQELYRFLEHLNGRGLRSSSIRRRLAGVKAFCKWLTTQNLIEADPSASLVIRYSRARRLPRALSNQDLRLLVTHLCDKASDDPIGSQHGTTNETTLLSVALMVGTGMRVGELVSLVVKDVDLQSRTVLVMGKGLRERMVYLSNARICGLIQSYLISRDNPDPLAPFLVNRDGRPMSTAALRSRICRAAHHAGITSTVTPHMLRHTAATQLIEAGVDIRFVQRLLGHASLTTTEIYTHVADTSLRRAIVEADVLGQVLTLR